jgi:DNA-binding transcriptional MerR regulator
MFRIGEFAQIAQVSGRQLRFYDELGLLEPAHIDAQLPVVSPGPTNAG